MSLITRCPACATMFKVVPDQLRISAGWVRCGVCGDVFDAAAGMLPAAQSKELEPLASLSASISAPTLLAASSDPLPSESELEHPIPESQAAIEEPVRVDHSVHETEPVLSDPHVPEEWFDEPLNQEALASESVPAESTPRAESTFPDSETPDSELPDSELPDSEKSESEVRNPALHESSSTEPSDAELDALADDFISARSYSVGLRPEGETAAESALQHTRPGYEPGDQTLPRADALLMRPAMAGSLDRPEEAISASLPNTSLPEPPDEDPVLAVPVRDATYADSIWPSPADSQSEDDGHKAPAADEVEVPSFVRQARRKAFWRSRGVRAFVWLAAVLAALGAGLYWTIEQRDWLAAREPRLAPLLAQICQPIGCTVEPYRNLNAIVIDGSSFQRGSTNSFQLGFTLRNTDDVPVATPSLELTLTDAQDRVIVRRALRAQDFSSSRTLSAQGEFSGTSALTVDSPDPSTIVGYRLVAFYP